MNNPLRNPAWTGWSVLFAIVAVWTALGAIPGFFWAEWTFESFYGAPPPSALVLDLYRGAWGQTLLFAIGYAFAAWNPSRHGLIAVLGATGKLLYAARLAASMATGEASAMTVLALVGDVVFAGLIFVFAFSTGQFLTYFQRRSESSR